jgi:hypothetical protein
MSNIVLAAIFHKKNKRNISSIIQEVLEALLEDFVPKYLGFQHVIRENVHRHHQTVIATLLMAQRNDQVILVLDGTRLYVQTSSNNEFRQRSFSMYKHRNLIKPTIITATMRFENQAVLLTLL